MYYLYTMFIVLWRLRTAKLSLALEIKIARLVQSGGLNEPNLAHKARLCREPFVTSAVAKYAQRRAGRLMSDN